MKVINTKEVLVDFKSEALKDGEKDLTIGTAVATILSMQTSNPALSWVLGKKFATEDTVELKAEEVVFLKKEIEDNQSYFSIVKGQLLEILDK